MGTRSLIAVKYEEEYKIAQYNQFNGSPHCIGADILGFVSKKNNLERLRKGLSYCRWAKGGEYSPLFNADMGADIINIIAASESECILNDSLEFAGDSLFCEWAYVVDYDSNTFEVFEGYNKEFIEDGRFKSSDFGLKKCDEFHPVKLLKSFKFNELPTNDCFIESLQS